MDATEAMTSVAIAMAVDDEASIKDEASSTATGITSRFGGGCMWVIETKIEMQM
jgi:hypothetical protein